MIRFGLVAPKATSTEIVDKLNKEIKARLVEQGTVLAGSTTAFGKLIADETEKWAKVIRAAHIKAE
jgi:tripartite-type tricarboxylate transporter receptor subunit TctC